MTKFVEFLVNNYIWFLVGAIVLIFALIGYLVDTKNKKKIASGEIIIKPKKEKKLKSKEDLTKESLSEMEDVTLGDAMKPKGKKKEEMPLEKPKEEKAIPDITYDTPIIKEEQPTEDSFEVDDK